MKLSVQEKKLELHEKRKALAAEMQKIDAQLQVLDEVEEAPAPSVDQPHFKNFAKELLGAPDIGISQAFLEGMQTLVHFTKPSLVEWIQKKYPNLEFSPRSIGRPLKDMMDCGKVTVVKRNVGNKIPAVYEFKPNKNGSN